MIDPRCYNLAQAFLWDQPNWFELSYQYREESKIKLAQVIQANIEDWITCEHIEQKTRSNT